MHPAVILFELEGLLLDTQRPALAGFVAASEALGLDPDAAEQFFLSLIGRARTVSRARIAAYFPQGDPKQIEQAWSQACALRHDASAPLKPMVEPALAQFSQGPQRLAVVSTQATDSAQRQLAQLGVAEIFEQIIGDPGVPGRADRPPFIQAVAAMGVDPSDCVAICASDTALRAASDVGCQLVQVPDLRPNGASWLDLGQTMAQDLLSVARRLGAFEDEMPVAKSA